MPKTRQEKDTMGTMEVPADAYYGAQTARALRNFPISGMVSHPEFVKALALVKRAAARANAALGTIPSEVGGAIEKAADEVVEGGLREHFVVDVLSAGAGVSLHMNTNEVIANRACEILGGSKGDSHLVHPNDHVNFGQSTNDVIPTAMRLSALAVSTRVVAAARKLAGALRGKARAFDPIVKSGRTHMQDATPVRLGQEFGAYAECMDRWAGAVEAAREGLKELGLGGTAVGSGLNTHPDYSSRVAEELSRLTGERLVPAPDLFYAMQSMAPFVRLSAEQRGLALDLIRIANDLRLLSSGPNTGLREIDLPAMQPGSSIMPGKVNPVMAEVADMVGFQVVGCDAVVAMASQAGQLELNVMMPVLIHNLLLAGTILANAVDALAAKCIAGITAQEERCRAFGESTVALATVLNPVLGYAKAAEIAKEAMATGRTIREILESRSDVTVAQRREILDLRRWTEPGMLEKPGSGG